MALTDLQSHRFDAETPTQTERHERRPPRVTVFRDWTPQILKSAEISAESGNLRQAVQICDWLLTDDAVAGALDVRHEQLLGVEPSFSPGEVPSAQVLAAYADDYPRMCTEPELAQLLDWGVLLGVSLARNDVAVDERTGRWLPNLEFWNASTLRQDTQTGQWSVRDADNDELCVSPGDGVWILHTPYGQNRPWARGLWRSLSRWCLIKQLAQRDWARHSEVGARLFAQTQLDRDGNAPPTTDEQRRQIVEEISNAGGEFVGALPPGWTVQLLELTANTRDIYLAQIEAANNAIRIRIRGGDLSSDAGGGGSYAAAQTQVASNEAPKRRYDNATLSPTLQTQHAKVWSLYNFGSKALAPKVDYKPAKAEPTTPRPATDTAPTPGAAGPGAVRVQAAEGEPAAPKPAEEQVEDATKFADKLAEEATAEAQRASADVMGTILAAVEASTSPADLKKRLEAAFADADLSELQAITEKAGILAELAGRYATLDEL